MKTRASNISLAMVWVLSVPSQKELKVFYTREKISDYQFKNCHLYPANKATLSQNVAMSCTLNYVFPAFSKTGQKSSNNMKYVI